MSDFKGGRTLWFKKEYTFDAVADNSDRFKRSRVIAL